MRRESFSAVINHDHDALWSWYLSSLRIYVQQIQQVDVTRVDADNATPSSSDLYLQKIRHDKRLNIDFSTEGKIVDQQISPMLFLPFIENSFKHGIGKQRSQSCIKIELQIQSDSLVFVVRNSQPESFPDQDQKMSGGIGLVNVKKRLDLIYKNNHELEIINKEHEYMVQLKLNTAAWKRDV